MKIRKLLPVAAVPPLMLLLTGCPGFELVSNQVAPNGSNYSVVAKLGENGDGGPSMFAAQVVCNGESFWRTGNWENVANYGGNWAESRVWCPTGRVVVGTNIARQAP